MFLISLSTWSNWLPGWEGGVILRLFHFQHFFPRALLHGLKLGVGWVGGDPCDYSVTPSSIGLWIFYFFWFGIGIRSRGTGFGTRAWQLSIIIIIVTDLLHVRTKRQPWTEDWAKQAAYKKNLFLVIWTSELQKCDKSDHQFCIKVWIFNDQGLIVVVAADWLRSNYLMTESPRPGCHSNTQSVPWRRHWMTSRPESCLTPGPVQSPPYFSDVGFSW